MSLKSSPELLATMASIGLGVIAGFIPGKINKALAITVAIIIAAWLWR